MYILAIDTSTANLGVALADQDRLLGRWELNAGRQASEALLPLTEQLLRLSGLGLDELSALAVTVGPGSFTGLRIGLATVKAWSQALDKPVIAVSTLAALAYEAAETGRAVCPLLNAGRGQLFAALLDSAGQYLLADSLISPAELAGQLTAYGGPIVCCGEGLAQVRELLQTALGENFLSAPPQRQGFLAAATALLGRDKFLKGELADPIMLEPLYLRPAAAEERRREAAPHV